MSKLSGFNFTYDILPLGNFETMPVVSKNQPYPKNYPEVVQLKGNMNVSLLRKDFLNFNKKVIILDPELDFLKIISG